jgi:hypothetical protein
VHTALEALSRELGSIGTGGSYFSRRTLDAGGLRLEVKDFGPIRLPVAPRTAAKLCEVAQPARHGYKDETRLDPKVRDTWEIGRRRVSIDEDRWGEALTPALARIARDLGLSEGSTLKAELHNLLVYGPGQFFRPHQDTEKAQGMIGTLVVCLPSQFKGGDMWVDHKGDKTVIRASPKDLTLVAFYADCHHEVRPVREGYRVVLTYNLLLQGERAASAVAADGLEALARRVTDFFGQARPPQRSSDSQPASPDRLVYLLDHEYTEKGLDWSGLKGADALRAAALREVAQRLDCQVYLALADVHETWDCVDEYRGYERRRRWGYDEFDDDPDVEDDDGDSGSDASGSELPEVTDLIDSEIELRNFVGPGRPPKALSTGVDDAELCYTTPTEELTPFKSEHEGYMGNWGNTVDHWYHRAAVVLWPRERTFLIQAKNSPLWAMEELARKLKGRGGAAEALPLAQRLLPFWQGLRYHGEPASVLAAALPVAAQLGDAVVAEALLAPYSLTDLTAKAARDVTALLESYGLDWFQSLLLRWTPAGRARHQVEGDLTWTGSVLVPLSRVLLCTQGGQAPARDLVARQWAGVRESLKGGLKKTGAKTRGAALAGHGKPLLALLEAASMAGAKDIQTQMLDLLTPEGEDLLPLQLAVLQGALHRGGKAPVLGLSTVHKHTLRTLTRKLQAPARSRDDWSIATPLSCSCRLCKQLRRYLAAPDQIRMEWPLPEGDRGHVASIIDSDGLPVRHSTRKQGRPYALVLEKTKKLFEQADAERRSDEQDLKWLMEAAGKL